MTPAPPGPRAGAWLLDLLITPTLPIAFYLGVGAIFSDDVPLAVGLPLALVLLVLHLLYAPLLLLRTDPYAGQTLGKQALGVRVVTAEGGAPLTLREALLREIVARSLLALVPFYFLVDHLLPFFDRRSRRALHDKIAETRVIRA
jgi:uncharacterized RDD family membrane protein YckC